MKMAILVASLLLLHLTGVADAWDLEDEYYFNNYTYGNVTINRMRDTSNWYWAFDDVTDSVDNPLSTPVTTYGSTSTPVIENGRGRNCYAITDGTFYGVSPTGSLIFSETYHEGYTVSFQFKVNQVGMDQMIVTSGGEDPNSSGFYVVFNGTTSEITVSASGDSMVYETATGTVSNGTWTHIAFAVDPLGPAIMLCIDGVYQPSSNVTVARTVSPTTVYSELRIGRAMPGFEGTFSQSSFLFDDLHLFDEVFSIQSMQNLYELSLEETDRQVRLNMDRTYENNLISGSVPAKVVRGTVSEIPGVYSGGMRLEPTAAIHLGIHTDCFGYPASAEMSDPEWCETGFSFLFWVRIHQHPDIPHDENRFIFGNTDLFSEDLVSGFIVFYKITSDTSAEIHFYFLGSSFSRIHRIYYVYIGRWHRVLMTFNPVIGGYTIDITEGRYNYYYVSDAYFRDLFRMQKTYSLKGKAVPMLGLYLGHPRNGGYFDVDELIICGEMWAPSYASTLDARSAYIRKNKPDDYDINVARAASPILFAPDRNQNTANQQHRKFLYIIEDALYYDGKSAYTKHDISSRSCYYDTQCKRGLTLRFWSYVYGTPNDAGLVYLVDKAGLDDHTWGYTVYYNNRRLFVFFTTQTDEWTGSVEFGLEQWTLVALAWYPNLGFSLHLNGLHQGFWSNRTRRSWAHSRLSYGEKYAYFGAQSGTSNSNLQSLKRFVMHYAVFYDRATNISNRLIDIGVSRGTYSNDYKWIYAHDPPTETYSRFTENYTNPMDVESGSWIIGSPPFQMLGSARLVYRNNYFGNATYLDGVDGVIVSDSLTFWCLTSPHKCSKRQHLISFWVKPLDKVGGDNNTLLWAGTKGDTVLRVQYGQPLSMVYLYTLHDACNLSVTIPHTEWSHVMVYFQNNGTNISQLITYIDGYQTGGTVSCSVMPKPAPTENVGHVIFGAGPSDNGFINHTAALIDDVKFMSTFKEVYPNWENKDENWVTDAFYLSNVTTTNLYLAEDCLTYMKSGFKSNITWLRVSPYPGKDWYIRCKYDDETGVTETIVPLDYREPRNVESGQDARNPDLIPHYALDVTAINIVKANSAKCKQFLSFTCDEASLFQNEDGSTYWKDADNIPHYYWPGASDDKPHNCYCGTKENCYQPTARCNCDGHAGMAVDDGYIEQRILLPITSLQLEYTTGTGTWTVGPLICSDIDPEGFIWSMDSLAVEENLPGKPGTLLHQSSAKLVAGVSGKAILLDGVSNAITWPGTNAQCMYDINKCIRGFSFSFFIKMDSSDKILLTNLAEDLDSLDSASGFQLHQTDGHLNIEIYNDTQIWKAQFQISENVWTFLCITWQNADPAVYVNGLPITDRGLTVVYAENTGNNHEVLSDQLLVLGRHNTNSMHYAHMAVDEFWFSPHSAYVPSQVTTRNAVYRRTYYQQFDNLSAVTDPLEGEHFILDTVGNVSQIIGIRNKAIKLTGLPGSKMSKTLVHECLVAPSFCSRGMTFSVWFCIDLSHWQHTNTPYPIFSTSDLTNALSEGITLHAIGRNGTLEIRERLNATKAVLHKTNFDIPLEKWVHFVFRWELGQRSEIWINGFKAATTSSSSLVDSADLNLPQTALTFGWSPFLPDLFTTVSVDEFLFNEWLDDDEQSFVTSLYLQGERWYNFTFEPLSRYGDIAMDEIGSPRLIRGRVGHALSLRNGSFLRSKLPFYSECLSQPSYCKKGFTLSFWLYLLPPFSSRGCIFSSNNGNHGISINYQNFDTNSSTIELEATVSKLDSDVQSLFVVNKTTWTHITLTWDMRYDFELPVWIDGQAITYARSVTVPIKTRGVYDSYLYLGSNADSGFTNMAIDELKFHEYPDNESAIFEEYYMGSTRGSELHWPLDFMSEGGTVDDGTIPAEYVNVAFSVALRDNGAAFKSSESQMDLGALPGSCMTDLNFCQRLNVFFFMFFIGNHVDQFIISRGSPLESESGFYLRYANMDNRLPLRRWFHLEVKHHSRKWSTLLNIEHKQWMQIQISWSAGEGLKLFVDKLLAGEDSSGEIMPDSVNELTYNVPLYLSRSDEQSENHAVVILDDLWIWNTYDDKSNLLHGESLYFVGCFTQPSYPSKLFSSSAMHPELCRSFCSFTYRFVGISEGVRCSCIDNLDRYTTLPPSDCSTTCPDTDNSCGLDISMNTVSVYRTTAHIPFPNVQPISNCSASIVGPYSHLDPPDMIVNENEPFILYVSCENGSHIIYNYTMTDKNVSYHYSEQGNISHKYYQQGTANGWVQLLNEWSSVLVPFSILVIFPQTPIENLLLESDAILTEGVLFPINVSLGNGTGVICLIDYGDDTSGHRYEDGLFPYTHGHIYDSIGTYNISIRCRNSLSEKSTTKQVKVEQAVSGLIVAENHWKFYLHELHTVFWNLTKGSHHQFIIGIGNVFSEVAAGKHAYTPNNTKAVGIYNCSLVAYNDISATDKIYFLLQVERQLQTLVVSAPRFAPTFSPVNVSVFIGEASNVIVEICYSTCTNLSQSGDLESWTGYFKISYTTPGFYTLYSKARDPLAIDWTTSATAVIALNPVKPLKLEVEKTTTLTDAVKVNASMLSPFTPASNVTINVTASKLDTSIVVICYEGSVTEFDFLQTGCLLTASGLYNITVIAWNEVSSERTSLVDEFGDKITGFSYSVNEFIIVKGTYANVSLYIDTGLGSIATLEWGDGNLTEGIDLDVRQWRDIDYLYHTAGTYNISLFLTNGVSIVKEHCLECIVVQERVTDLIVEGPFFFTYGEQISIPFRVGTGSHLSVRGYMNTEHRLTAELFDKSGFLTLDDTFVPHPGHHNVTLMVWNNVTEPNTDSFNITVVKPITMVSLFSSSNLLSTNLTANLTLSVNDGSFVTLTITAIFLDIDAVSQIYNSFIVDALDTKITIPVSIFHEPGKYRFNAFVENVIGNITAFSEDIRVENPVLNLRLRSYEPDNCIYPAQIILDINLNVPDPSDISIHLQTGDGYSVNKSSFVNSAVKEWVTNYQYSKDGVYNLTAYVSNQISSVEATGQVTVGLPISNLSIHASPLVLATGSMLLVSYHLLEGTNAFITVIMGDGTNVSQPLVTAQFQNISHSYTQAGLYVISAVAQNALGKTAKKLTRLITVQDSIDDTEINSTKSVYDVDAVNAAIEFFIGQGTNASCEVHLNGMQIYAAERCARALSLPIPSHMIVGVGVYMFNLTVWNLVTEPVVSSGEFSVERNIGEIRLVPYPFVWPIRESIIFIAIIEFGSNVNATFTYSDGLGRESNYFAGDKFDFMSTGSRSFDIPGTIQIQLSVINPLGSKFIESSIIIQTPIYDGELHVFDSAAHQIPSQVAVTFNQGDIPPSDISLKCITAETSLVLDHTDFVLVDHQNFVGELTFPFDGLFNVSCDANNSMSTWTSTVLVQIGNPVSNLTIIASKFIISTRDLLDVSFGIGEGSNVEITISFGDGSVYRSNNITDGVKYSISHDYPIPGVYVLNISSFNAFGQVMKQMERLVLSFEPVEFFTLSSNSDVYSADDDIALSWNVLRGTNISCQIVLNGRLLYDKQRCSQNGRIVLPSGNISGTGEHVSELFVWNPVTERQRHAILLTVAKPVVGLNVSSEYEFVIKNHFASFNVTVFGGSDYVVSVWYSDGYVHDTNNFPGENFFNAIMYQRNFTKAGQITANVAAVNKLGEVKSSAFVFVQALIEGVFANASDSSGAYDEVELIISVTETSDAIGGAEMTVVWGDGDISHFTSVSLNSTVPYVLQHSYSEDGYKIINISLANNINVVNLTASCRVGEEVRAVSAWLSYGLVQPFERVGLCFNVTQGSSAAVTVVTDVELITYPELMHPGVTGCVTLRFSSTGEKDINVTAANVFNNETTTLVLFVEERIVGLRLVLPDAAIANESTEMTLKFVSLGKMYCVLWDLGDDSERYVYGGDECETKHTSFIFRKPLPDSSAFTLQHTYSEKGIYTVSVYAYNMVSHVNITESITSVFCQKPTVKLNGLGSRADMPVNTYRSQKLRFVADITNPCNIPWNITMTWRLTAIPEGNIRRNLSVPVPQFNSPTLEIHPKDILKVFPNSGTTSVAILKVYFHAQVGPYYGIDDDDTKYVRLIPTDLQVQIGGGLAKSASLLEPLVIDARNTTFDPDDLDSQHLFKYIWKYRAEGSVTWVDIFSPSRRKRAVPELASSKPHLGLLVLDQRSLLPGIYEFQMHVFHGLKSGTFIQRLSVIDGFVPEISIRCLDNCLSKVSTNKPLRLESSCLNCDPSTAWQHSWSLYQINRSGRVLLSLDSHTTTGTNTKQLAISGGTLKPGHTYSARLSMSAARKHGFAEFTFSTNLPPYGGECKASPDRGVMMFNKFTFQCSNWMDEGLASERNPTEDPFRQSELVYRFFYKVRGSSGDMTLFYYGTDPSTMPHYLTMGYKTYNYMLDIIVWISDFIGDYTVFTTEVQVAEFYLQYDELDKMLTGSVRELDFLYASKDVRGITGVLSSVTEQLDRRNEVSECDQVCAEEKFAEDAPQENDSLRITIRSGLVMELDKTIKWIDTVDGVKSTGRALKTITDVPSELSHEAKSQASSIMLSLSTILLSSEASEELVHAASNEITQCAANLLSDLHLESSVSPEQVASLDLPPDEKSALLQSTIAQQHAERETKKLLAKDVVENSLESFDNIQKSCLRGRLADEEPVIFGDSVNLGVTLHRVSIAAIDKKQMPNLGSSFQGLSAVAHSIKAHGLDTVDMQLVSMVNNPFIWEDSGQVTTQVAGLKFRKVDGGEISISGLPSPFTVSIPSQKSQYSQQKLTEHVLITNVPEDVQDIVVHNISFTAPNTAMEISLQPKHEKSSYRLFIRLNHPVDDVNYDEKIDLTWESGYNRIINIPQGMDNGTFFIGVRQTSRRAYESIEYHFSAVMRGCVYWNMANNAWQGDGCRVTASSQAASPDVTTCSCNHLTFFGGNFIVAPNTIDFNSVWGKFADIGSNWVVLVTIGGIFVIYWTVVLVLRRLDKADLNRWKVRPLLDNRADDSFYYVMTVVTGNKYGAATNSKVSFILVGEDGDSDIRCLEDGKRKFLEKGSCNHYLLTVPESLGELLCLRVWHDQSGRGSYASWYLQEFIIHDVVRNERRHFICNEWLAADRGDGQIERMIPAATTEEAQRFGRLFKHAAKRELSDAHLWLSVFSRPTRSGFTRVQRWSCCLSLLLTTMITSAMWFGRLDDEQDKGQLVKLGPFMWSTKQFFIATMSSLIVFPINFVIIQIFRSSVAKEESTNPKLGDFLNSYSKKPPLTPSQVSCIIAGAREESETCRPTNTDDGSDKKRDKKWWECRLPHWFVYVAWVLCFLSVVGSAFFCILYSMEWGQLKSREWMTSMAVSFIQSFVVIQPLKVLIVALLVTLIFRNYKMDDDIQINGEDVVIEHNNEAFIQSRALRSQMKVDHFDMAKLMKMKQKQKKENEMEDRLGRVLLYSVFVVTLWVITYGERSPYSYNITRHIESSLINPIYQKMKSLDEFEMWANEIFLPVMMPITEYNGHQIKDWRKRRYFALGGSFYKLGKTRFRQLRVAPGLCEVAEQMDSIIHQCNTEFSSGKKEDRSFGPGWIRLDVNANVSYDAWRFRPSSETKALSTWGQMDRWYGGGGYVLEHTFTLSESLNYQKAVFHQGWLDKYTRAIICEIPLYNPDANLFAWVKIILERPATGGIHPSWEISVLNLYTYTGSFALFRVILEIVFCFFVLASFIKIARSIHKYGLKLHFKGFMSYLDIFINVWSTAAVAMYVVRFFVRDQVVSDLSNNEDQFIDLGHLAYYDRIFTCVIAILVAITSLRMLILLNFNARVKILFSALSRSVGSLGSFALIFGVTMAAFSLTANQILGPSVHGFTTIIESCESLLAGFMGARMFQHFDAGNTFLGRTLYILFALVMVCFLANILISILMDGVDAVKKDIVRESKRENYLKLISERVADILGLDRFYAQSQNITRPQRKSVALQAGPPCIESDR